MLKKFLPFLLKIFPSETVFAHCDIPCGIYDPHIAQMAAHTVIRMTSLINDLTGSSPKDIHQICRLTQIKEEHAELIKREVRIIWGDYFKEDHLKDYPNLHVNVFKIMKLASKVRQEINIEAANDLLAKVQDFAEIFYKTKGFEIVRIPSGYPTGGEIVSHK
ncbi:MAG: superoxide dismutase, Ni [Candidatus Levybacteria bacterium]|nr:superoxide dismutase, Ni [Candidatus Levybacteria bacterium]